MEAAQSAVPRGGRRPGGGPSRGPLSNVGAGRPGAAGPCRLRRHHVHAQPYQCWSGGDADGCPAAACCRWSPLSPSPTAAPPSSWRGSGSSGPATRSARWRSAPTARSGSRSSSSSSPSGRTFRPRCSAGWACTCGCGASSPPTCSSPRYVRRVPSRSCSCCWRSRSSCSASATRRSPGRCKATNGTIKLGGYIGLVTAIAAWYASFAAVINSTFAKTILPVFPLRPLTRGAATADPSGVQLDKTQPRTSRPARAPAATAGARC